MRYTRHMRPAGLIALIWAMLISVFLVFSAVAQSDIPPPDYDVWETVATRAEVALEGGRASNSAMEGLRTEIAGWRTQFSAVQGENDARISTLRNQISSLGPAPDPGGTEPAILTQRRTELTAQLAELEAPQVRAVEAFSRANGLIKEIDAVVRGRQAARLFELKPTPINPGNWPEANRSLSASLSSVRSEIATAWQSDALQKRLNDNLAVTLIYLVIAFVLLVRGRTWMVQLTMRAQRTATGPSADLRSFLVSLGQIILPLIGIFAFAQAVFSIEILGLRGQIFADGIVKIGIAFFIARWLSLRIFPKTGQEIGRYPFPEAAARKLRNIAAILAVVWGLNELLLQLENFESYSQSTRVVLHFPLIVVAGFLLFRFGRILRANILNNADDPEAVNGFRIRATEVVARALVVVGVAAPLFAVVGYYTAAAAAVFPSILTIGLFAFLLILTGVSRSLYLVVTDTNEEDAHAALIPVLVNFAIALSSVPFLALIWGARTSDIWELWARFREGFQLGDTRISPTDFMTFAVVFVAGYMLTRVLQSTLKTSVLPKTKIEKGGQTAIVSGLGYVGVFLAAVIAITTAGIDLSSLAIVAGALSVGIGFGLQNIVSNFVSGIILLIERPIAVGDWIEVGGYSGNVTEISVRSTRIATFDRTEVIIPNSDLVSGAVTNYTRGNLVGRAVIKVGVAYGSDTRHVERMLKNIAENHPMVSLNPAPSVHLVGFGADSLDFEIRAILRDVNFILTVKSDIMHDITKRFAAEGIEIPFAQRDLWLRNPETLQAPVKPTKPPKSAK